MHTRHREWLFVSDDSCVKTTNSLKRITVWWLQGTVIYGIFFQKAGRKAFEQLHHQTNENLSITWCVHVLVHHMVPQESKQARKPKSGFHPGGKHTHSINTRTYKHQYLLESSLIFIFK